MYVFDSEKNPSETTINLYNPLFNEEVLQENSFILDISYSCKIYPLEFIRYNVEFCFLAANLRFVISEDGFG